MNFSLINSYIFPIRSLILLHILAFKSKEKRKPTTTNNNIHTHHFSFFLCFSSNNKSLDFCCYIYISPLSVVHKHSLTLPKYNVAVDDEKKVCSNVSIQEKEKRKKKKDVGEPFLFHILMHIVKSRCQ